MAIGAVLTGVLVAATVLALALLLWVSSPSVSQYWSTASAPGAITAV